MSKIQSRVVINPEATIINLQNKKEFKCKREWVIFPVEKKFGYYYYSIKENFFKVSIHHTKPSFNPTPKPRALEYATA